jgi:PST family polysaccharide transporter
MIRKIKAEILGHTNFFKVTFLSSISSGLKIVGSFIVGKIMSIYIGPNGFAISGQLNNFLSILHAFGSAGVNLGLTKYVSENENNERQRNKYVQSTFWLMFLFTFISSFALIIFSSFVSNVITKSPSNYIYIVFLGFAMFFYNTGQIFLAIVNGYKHFKSYVFINIIITIFSFLISIGLIYRLGLNGVIISIIANLFLYFLVVLPFVKKAGWFTLKSILPKYNKVEVRKLFSYSLMFLFSSSVIPIVQILLRSHLISRFSITDAGLWEALNRISQIPVLILTTAFSTYYLPSLAQIKTRELMQIEVKKTIRIIFAISGFVLLVIYFLRSHLILLVFNESFSILNNLLLFQLLGDFFRMLSFVFAFVLLAKAQTTFFVVAELIFGITLYLTSLFFLNIFGLIGITYSYFISYVFYFIIVILFFKKCKI